MGHEASFQHRDGYDYELEVKRFLQDKFSRESLDYRMLLHAAYQVFRHLKLFQGHEDKLADYLKDLGPIRVKEARKVVTYALNNFYPSLEEAKERLPMILKAMRIRRLPVPGRCVSPSVDRNIYLKVMQGIKQNYWDPTNPPILFHFSDPEVMKEKSRQWNENRSMCCDPVHTLDAACVLMAHHIYTDNVKNYVPLKSGDKPTRPLGQWNPNLKYAIQEKKFMLIRYILWLVPEMLYLPVDGFKTLVHLAAELGYNDILYHCHQIGYDLGQHSGICDPIHVACDASQPVLRHFGAVWNRYMENGWSWLHDAADGDNKDAQAAVIRAILMQGEDVTKPDSEGTFWLQYALYGTKTHRRCNAWMRKVVCCAIAQSKNPIYDDTNIRSLAQLEMSSLTSELEKALRTGDIAKIGLCLALGRNVNHLLRDGSLPLSYCIKQSDPIYDDCAAMLIANYATPNAVERNGCSVFRIACAEHKFKAAEMLLKYGAEASALGKDGLTVLHWAYQAKDFEVLDFVLTRGDANYPNKDGVNITFIAFLDRDDSMAERLQDKYGGNINCQLNGQSLAHLAFEQGDFGRISYLIARHIDLELKNQQGRTVLMEAAIRSEANLCETLLRHGADPNATDPQGRTSLILATDYNTIKVLLENGATVDATNESGTTKLMTAAQEWRADICRSLLDHGANANLQATSKELKGRTPLHMCLHTKGVEDNSRVFDAMIPVIKTLISKMDEPDIQDGQGNTALFLAAYRGSLEICSELIATGRVDVHKTNNKQETVLFAASDAPVFNRALFDMLMDAGCDVNIPAKSGVLPLALLIKHKRYNDAMDLIRDGRCTVLDNPKCKTSPILAALDNGNQEIVEELFRKGVTAGNSVRSVIVEYCRQAFFDVRIFHNMGTYNLIVGGPIPTLMGWNWFEHARWLWDFARDKAAISGTTDYRGKTPLILCIHARQNAWAEELINPKYNLTKRDRKGKTPLMYCARYGHLEWTRRICQYISIEKAGVMNKRGLSALTHMANQKWKSLCDELFMAGIDLPDVIDTKGIIEEYVDIVREQEKAIKAGQETLDEIDKAIDRGARRMQKLHDWACGKNETLMRSAHREMPKVRAKIDKWRDLRMKKSAEYAELKNSSRRDWLRDYDSMQDLKQKVCRIPCSLSL